MLNKILKSIGIFFVYVYHYLVIFGLAFTVISPLIVISLIFFNFAGKIHVFAGEYFSQIVFLCTLPVFIYLVVKASQKQKERVKKGKEIAEKALGKNKDSKDNDKNKEKKVNGHSSK